MNGVDPIHLPKLISDEFGLSTSEARRLIVQGGVKVDGQTDSMAEFMVPPSIPDGRGVNQGAEAA